MKKQRNGLKKSVILAIVTLLCISSVYTAMMPLLVAEAATPAPTGILIEAENGRATISWDAVSGAKTYALFMKDAVGNVTLVHNRITGTSYSFSGLKDGARYGFVLKAYTSAGWSGYSSTVWATSNVVSKAPENITVVPGDGEVTVSWSPSYAAQTYAIFLKDTSGNVTLIHNRVNGTSYTVKGMKNGVRMGFVVKAYVNRQWSPWSKVVWATPMEANKVPENLKANVRNDKITLTWDGVQKAEKYAVYQKSKSGTVTLLNSTVKENSYEIIDFPVNEVIGFVVKACVNGVWSSYSESVWVTVKVTIPTVTPTPTATPSPTPTPKPMVEVTDANGTKFELELNDNKKMVEQTYYIDGELAGTNTVTYNEDGSLASLMFYDKNGDLVGGRTHSYYYDGYQNYIYEVKATADVSYVLDYDAETGSCEFKTAKAGKRVELSSTNVKESEIVWETVWGTEIEKRTQYVYTDGVLQMSMVCSDYRNGLNYKTSKYDAYGNLTGYDLNDFYENGAIKEYKAYDAFGCLRGEMHYDNDGNEKCRIEYFYNEDGKLIMESHYNPENIIIKRIHYIYNEDGTQNCYTIDSFDGSGRQTGQTQHYPNGEVTSTEYLYNEQGLIAGYKYYNADGTLRAHRHADYDESGVIIGYTEYSDWINSRYHRINKYNNLHVMLEYVIVQYNEKGLVCDEFDYGSNGVMTKHTEYRYDEADKIIEVSEYDGADLLCDKWRYVYDEDGNLVSKLKVVEAMSSSGHLFELEINEKKAMVKQTYYAGDTLVGTNLVSYNEDGEMSEIVFYNADGERIGNLKRTSTENNGTYEVVSSSEDIEYVYIYVSSMESCFFSSISAGASRETYSYSENGYNYVNQTRFVNSEIVGRTEYRYKDEVMEQRTEYSNYRNGFCYKVENYSNQGLVSYVLVERDADGDLLAENIYDAQGRQLQRSEYDEDCVCVLNHYYLYHEITGVLLQSDEYDGIGKLLSRHYYENDIETKHIKYNEDGAVKAVTYYNDNGTVRSFDEYLYHEDGTLRVHVENTYDENGRQKWQYQNYPDGSRTSTEYVYDESGKQIRLVYYNEDGAMREELLFDYDENDQLTGFTKYSDLRNDRYYKITKYDVNYSVLYYSVLEYDEDGTLQKVSKYDSDGTLIEETDGEGNPLKPNTVDVMSPNGALFEVELNDNGLMVKQTYYKNEMLIGTNLVSYNENGEITQIDFYDADDILIGTMSHVVNEDNSVYEEVTASQDVEYVVAYNVADGVWEFSFIDADTKQERYEYYEGEYFHSNVTYYANSTINRRTESRYKDGELDQRTEYSDYRNGFCYRAENYNSQGLVSYVLVERDADGNLLAENVYDAKDRIIQKSEYEADCVLNWYQLYSYDETTGELKGAVEYDGTGKRLVQHYYENGKETGCDRFRYNEDGMVEIESHYDAIGMLSYFKEYSYDENGKVEFYTENTFNEAGLQTWQYQNYSDGTTTSTEYLYDESGKRTGCKYYNADKTLNATKKINYDVEEKIVGYTVYSEWSNGKHHKVTEYDSENNMLSYLVLNYDENDRLHRIEEYDETGNMEKKYHYFYSYGTNGDLQWFSISEFEEIAENQWCEIRSTQYDANGVKKTYNEFAYNEQLQASTRWEYGADGELLFYVIYEYNDHGQESIDCFYDPTGNILRKNVICYNESGEKIGFVEYTDFENNEKPGHIIERDNNNVILRYSYVSYNVAGDIDTQTNYDSKDRMVSREQYYYENGTLSVHIVNTYDEVGLQTWQYQKYPDGITTSTEYLYDESGMKIGCKYYNADGTLRELSQYVFDENGLVIGFTGYSDFVDELYHRVTEYNGNYIMQSYSILTYNADGSIDTQENYNDEDRMTSRERYCYYEDGSLSVQIIDTYDENSRHTWQYQKYPNGSTTSTETLYDEQGEINGYKYYNADGSFREEQRFDFDENGLVVGFTGYSDLQDGRYCRITKYDINSAILNYTVYTYDAEGNISRGRLYNAKGQLILYSFYNSTGERTQATGYEYYESGELKKTITYMGELIPLQYNCQDKERNVTELANYYYVEDELSGYTVFSYNGAGQVIGVIRYNSDGEVRNEEGGEVPEVGTLPEIDTTNEARLITGTGFNSREDAYSYFIDEALDRYTHVGFLVDDVSLIYTEEELLWLYPELKYATVDFIQKYANGYYVRYAVETIFRVDGDLAYAARTGETSVLDEEDREPTTYAKILEISEALGLDEMSDIEKIYAVHNYLILNAAYDHEQVEFGSHPDAHYACGAILDGKTVCSGYASAFRIFMILHGINCEYAWSDIDNHGWNLVELDGEWYQMDVTWDDPDFGELVEYDYFMTTSGTIEAAGGHRNWQCECGDIHNCDSTDYVLYPYSEYVCTTQEESLEVIKAQKEEETVVVIFPTEDEELLEEIWIQLRSELDLSDIYYSRGYLLNDTYCKLTVYPYYVPEESATFSLRGGMAVLPDAA